MLCMGLFLISLYLCHSNGESDKTLPIQTFVVPHSHMDVGWVYTIQVCLSPNSLVSKNLDTAFHLEYSQIMFSSCHVIQLNSLCFSVLLVF